MFINILTIYFTALQFPYNSDTPTTLQMSHTAQDAELY